MSDEGLRGLGKPDARAAGHGEALEVLHRHGVANIGCFILGLDTDGPGSIAATERFIRDHVDVPQVSLLTPFPGTPLFRRMEAEGRLLHRDWSKYDITHVVFRPARMSPDELEAAYAGLVRRVYSPAAIGARVLRNVLRRTVNGMPRFRLAGRVTSILAPNLVYRRLSLLGRGGGTIPAIGEAPEARQGSPTAARGHAARPAWAHAGGVGA